MSRDKQVRRSNASAPVFIFRSGRAFNPNHSQPSATLRKFTQHGQYYGVSPAFFRTLSIIFEKFCQAVRMPAVFRKTWEEPLFFVKNDKAAGPEP